VSDVTEINSDMCDPSNGGYPCFAWPIDPASILGTGEQRRRSIIVALPGRQAGIEGCVLPRHQPRAAARGWACGNTRRGSVRVAADSFPDLCESHFWLSMARCE